MRNIAVIAALCCRSAARGAGAQNRSRQPAPTTGEAGQAAPVEEPISRLRSPKLQPRLRPKGESG